MTQRMRLVPEVATEEMVEAGIAKWFEPASAADTYAAMIGASPNGGCVTGAMLERAAEAHWNALQTEGRFPGWQAFSEADRGLLAAAMRAALAALGLVLASEPTRSEGEG